MPSKRIMMILFILFSLLVAVVACGSEPEAPGAAEEDAAEERAEEAASAEDAAEDAAEEAVETVSDMAGVEPYPEAVPLMDSAEVTKYNLDEILTYKALDSYQQPEWMDALVADGSLPPVEERLPTEPQVILTGGMSDGIGTYGGVWRDFSACPTEGFNRGAGQSAGWFGIEAAIFASLLKSGPIYRRGDAIEPLPHLAKSWEWSDDGYELTMHLIEGAKWSDGHPLTTEDILFTWEDMIMDPNVNSPKGPSAWEINGEQTTLEIIDDYTFKFTFAAPFPVSKLFIMDEGDFHVSPAHVLKPIHPKYNDDYDYVSFEGSMPPDQTPVVLGAWVPVLYQTDQLMILRRNPYFWKVDEEGRQLPYLDEVVFEKGSTGVGRTLGTLAGSLDHSNLENPSTFVEMLKRMEEPDAHFYVEWGPETLGYALHLNLSADLGTKDERDTTIRELFRDLRFRRALSHAIDRDGVAQSILRGPFLRPWAGGLYPGSSYFSRDSVVYYPYNVDLAKSLLAEIGFEDTDGNGVLNWTSGPLEGEDLVIGLNASQDAEETTTTAEALVALFNEVGIQINYRPLNSTALNDLNQSGEWDMRISREGQQFAVPFTRCTDLAPVTKESPGWHREGAEARQLQPFEEDLVGIINEFCLEPDTDARRALMDEYNRIYTENLYTIGVFIGRYGLAAAKRFNNIPTGMPVFLYNWTWENAMPEQVWVDPENQIDHVKPEVIPTY